MQANYFKSRSITHRWGLRAAGHHQNTTNAYKLADYADKAVYLSADGSDSNDGDLSSRPVKTFARASQLIRDTQLKEIRITGTKPIPVTTAATWVLPGRPPVIRKAWS